MTEVSLGSRIVVPVRRPTDVARLVPLAAKIAAAMSLPVNVLTIVHPDDDLADEFRGIVEAVRPLADAVDTAVTCRMVCSGEPVDQFLGVCSDELVIMSTAASPFKDGHYVGSFAASLLAHATKPVILVGPNFTAETALDWTEVVTAVATEIESTAVLPYAHALGLALDLDLCKVHIDMGTGNIYLSRYGKRMWFPDEVHATIGVEALEGADVSETLLERSANQLLAVRTHARAGLAWIADGSVAFDAVSKSASPILAVGPNVGEDADHDYDLEPIDLKTMDELDVRIAELEPGQSAEFAITL